MLFLILIAVALFAGLSYAVTGSNRTSGTTIESEKDKLKRAVSDSCEAQINQAVSRVKLFNACTDETLNYLTPSGFFENTSAPTDGSCNIFSPTAGGAVVCGPYDDLKVVNTDSELNDPSKWNLTLQGSGWSMAGGKIIGTNTTGQALTLSAFPLNTAKTYRTEIKVNSISGAQLNIAYWNPGNVAHRLVPTISAPGTYSNDSWTPSTAIEWLRVTPTSHSGSYEIEYIRIIEKSE